MCFHAMLKLNLLIFRRVCAFIFPERSLKTIFYSLLKNVLSYCKFYTIFLLLSQRNYWDLNSTHSELTSGRTNSIQMASSKPLWEEKIPILSFCFANEFRDLQRERKIDSALHPQLRRNVKIIKINRFLSLQIDYSITKFWGVFTEIAIRPSTVFDTFIHHLLLQDSMKANLAPSSDDFPMKI